jgi:hypothetical protein
VRTAPRRRRRQPNSAAAAAQAAPAADSAEAQQAQAVVAARTEAAARPGGLAPLMADMEQAAGNPALPDTVQTALTQILALRLSIQSAPTADDIKSAFQNSGLLTESQFAAKLASPSAEISAGSDLKSLLLVLKQSLSDWPATRAQATSPSQPATTTNTTNTAGPSTSPQTAPTSNPTGTQAANAPAPPTASSSSPQAPPTPSSAANQALPPPTAQTSTAAPAQTAAPTAPTSAPTSAPVSAQPSPSASDEAPAPAPAPQAETPALSSLSDDALPPFLSAALAGAQTAPGVGGGGAGAAFPTLALLQALGIVKTMVAPENDGNDDTDAPISTGGRLPVKGGQTSAQSPAASSLSKDSDATTVGRQLLSDSETALAHQKLLQMASLPEQTQTGRTDSTHWMFEIPLSTPSGTAIAQFVIDKDGGGKDEEGKDQETVWRARFSVDVEPLGPVHAGIAIGGEKTWVTLWADRRASLEKLKADTGTLTDALKAEDLTAEIAFRPVLTPKPVTIASGHFLDHLS